MRHFFPHQQTAMDWAADRDRVAFLIEMRLGKTLLAIRWANQRNPGGLNLVVAPLSVLPAWEAELAGEGLPSKYLTSVGDREACRAWYLTNYERVRQSPLLLSNINWGVIIVDESTRIKNPQAKTTKTLIAHTFDAPNKAILTGLPAPESLLDYYSQFAFLNGGSGSPGFMGFRDFWRWRAALFEHVGYDWRPKPGTREKIKDAVAAQSFILSRKSAGVGSVKLRQRRYVGLPPVLAKAYRQGLKDWEIGDRLTKFAVQRATLLSQLVGGSLPDYESNHKVDELVSLLKTELKGEPVVVWFRFNAEIQLVADALRKAGLKFGAVTGLTKPRDRVTRANRWAGGLFSVLLMQLKVGRYGLNLSHASTAIYYSNDYSLETREQSEDRIVHPTKTDPLLVVDLIAKDTIDEDAVDALASKRIDAKILLARAAARGRR